MDSITILKNRQPSKVFGFANQGMAQWWEYSPPSAYQCGPGSNPDVDAICRLSLLLILSFAPGGFSLSTPVFPSPQKPTFPNSNSTRNQARWRTILWMCYLQIITYFFLSLLLLYFGFKINRQSSKLTPHWDTLFHEVHKRRFQTLTPVEDRNRSFCNPVKQKRPYFMALIRSFSCIQNRNIFQNNIMKLVVLE